MPPATLSREEVLDRVLSVFRTYGYEGASMSRISESTGLGRSSLYHHFPGGKDDMAAAIFAHAEISFREHVAAPLLLPGGPNERLGRLAAGLVSFYADGSESCLLDVFGIGRAGELFGDRLGARITTLKELLAGLARQAGASRVEAMNRAEDTIVAIQGSLVVSRALNSDKPFRRMLGRLADLLLRGDSGASRPARHTPPRRNGR